MKGELEKVLDRIVDGFLPFLNQSEEQYFSQIAGLQEEKKKSLSRYRNWDWFQGVGLYGLFQAFCQTGKERYRKILLSYYEERISEGLPLKNINTVCPMLALCRLAQEEKKREWIPLIEEWAWWLMNEAPRTEEGGFQHITAESNNEGQLWDDTLFMAVLFLAEAGMLLRNKSMQEEAMRQFFLHEQYLADRRTGLWYHGFSFLGRHHFGQVFWARGNCWITLSVPELVSRLELNQENRDRMIQIYSNQVQALKKCQDSSGLWHTVLDDETSYLEASASAGIGAGILMGTELGILPPEDREVGLKPLKRLIELTDEQGFVHQVSIGTPVGENKACYKSIPLAPMAYGQALTMVYLVQASSVLGKLDNQGKCPRYKGKSAPLSKGGAV